MSDIDLADASEGIVFGFNVPIPEAVTAHAQRKRVELRTYNVIYDLIDEVTSAMEGLLDNLVGQLLSKDVMLEPMRDATVGGQPLFARPPQAS